MRLIAHLSQLNWPVGPEQLGGLLADIGGLVDESALI